ncbi:helix-turn-helix domain-containing protein [Streptomyces sp. NPDC057020]|uniref:helix-turn-helix domain-containing protein n=1 Tax=unclassified Streptomyces TaxID=2593676 RepID=UPI00363CB3C7
MAEESAGGEEEARQVFEALDALKAMTDEAARARGISAVLKEQQPRLKELSALRRAYVLDQRAKNVSYRKIAAEIGVSSSTVQDIERGYSGSGRDRPRKAKHDDDRDGDSGNP